MPKIPNMIDIPVEGSDVTIINYLLNYSDKIIVKELIEKEMLGNIITWIMNYLRNSHGNKDDYSHAFNIMIDTPIMKWNMAQLSPFLYICFCRAMIMNRDEPTYSAFSNTNTISTTPTTNKKLENKEKLSQIYNVIIALWEGFSNIDNMFELTYQDLLEKKKIDQAGNEIDILNVIFSFIMNENKVLKSIISRRDVNSDDESKKLLKRWAAPLIQNIMRIILQDLLNGLNTNKK